MYNRCSKEVVIMNVNELRTEWLAEEEIAHIKGWDFSHIEGKFKSEEDEMPWDYALVIKKYLKPTDRILDIDTGGGEFLLSLQHPYELTSATEGYAPNVTLCKQTLPPLGIDFRELVQMLLPGTGKSFPGHNLKKQSKLFTDVGFTSLEQGETYKPIRFYDTAALVWFARVIVWEFVNFSVDHCFDRLLEVEKKIRKHDFVEGQVHRFYFVMRK